MKVLKVLPLAIVTGLCVVADVPDASAQVEQPQSVVAPQVDRPILRAYVDGTLTFLTDRSDLGKYWIGLTCEVATDTLRRHLKIEQGGLVVGAAHEDSAAAKAGLKEHDVLVSANQVPLTDLGVLIREVQKVETGELKLDVIRDGEHLEVIVHPEERPQVQLTQSPVTGQLPSLPDGTPFRQFLMDQGDSRSWAFIGPGRLVPFGNQLIAPNTATLPPGVSVAITREGGKPAKIHVKRGQEAWEINETELDQLPVELRAPVGAMINQQSLRVFSMPNWGPTQTLPGTPYRTYTQQLPAYPAVPTAPGVVPGVIPHTPQTLVVPRNELQQLRDAIRKLTEKVDALEKRE